MAWHVAQPCSRKSRLPCSAGVRGSLAPSVPYMKTTATAMRTAPTPKRVTRTLKRIDLLQGSILAVYFHPGHAFQGFYQGLRALVALARGLDRI